MSKKTEKKEPILKDTTKDLKRAKAKAIHKKVGKVFVLAIVASAVVISSVFGFVGCGKTNNNNTANITPVPIVAPMTVGEAFNKYPSQTQNFVREIVNEATEIYDDDEIIYLAYDIGDKNETQVDDVTLYVGVKGNENERFFMEKNCLFSPVSAESISKGAAILSELVIETPAPIKYDGAAKQSDSAFLDMLYGEERDVVLTEYQKETFEEQSQIQPIEVKIHDVATLIGEYAPQAQAFGDKVASAMIKEYNAEDAIYCGYSFEDADEDGKISAMILNLATKTGETEREYVTYKVIFDKVSLDEIADGSSKITNAKNAVIDTINYDALEVQQDQTFLSNLYEQDDFSYIAYEDEVFQNMTIQDLIANYGDQINENLQPLYEGVLKKAFGRNYNPQRYDILSYQWDLGEVVDNKTNDLKCSFKYYDNLADGYCFKVYNLNFAEDLDISQFTQNNFPTTTISQAIEFVYNPEIQGTRADLINAIIEHSVNDGFDYSNAEVLFTEKTSSTDADLGTIRRFTVVLTSESGVRQINFSVSNAKEDESLIEKINNGEFKVNDYIQAADFSENQLAEQNFQNDYQIN